MKVNIYLASKVGWWCSTSMSKQAASEMMDAIYAAIDSDGPFKMVEKNGSPVILNGRHIACAVKEEETT